MINISKQFFSEYLQATSVLVIKLLEKGLVFFQLLNVCDVNFQAIAQNNLLYKIQGDQFPHLLVINRGKSKKECTYPCSS